ncbi:MULTISPECIES: VOC family protein [unclassified Nocardia]|uniref:VOC family protein n=1 Tax=unclassified Nocardia TaxID=2637762 RepID=UPI0024A9B5BF|nr:MULTISPECIES: VOC family protein [unclassified Nocardia]
MSGIGICLWFDDEGEEAARYYTAIFKNSKITSVVPYGDAFPGKAGDTMLVEFELNGQRITALNGGKMDWSFNEAISLMIDCEDQAEVDHYWNALTADGGQEGPCGWLKDKYGVSWQITPKRYYELADPTDPARADRVNKALESMKKIDLATLEQAAVAG